MNKKKFLADYIKKGNMHAMRLSASLNRAQQLLPFNAEKFENLKDDDVAYLDMLTTRFSKLQDIIGAKIFPLTLDILGEDALTVIDKLNKLEKLGYISDVNWWMRLREIRNEITHDYPDSYDLLAAHFNNLVGLATEFSNYWIQLKKQLQPLLD